MVLSRIIDGGLKVLDQEKLILDSGLFDPTWYAAQHDLKADTEKSIGHFLKSRGKHDPSPKFSGGAYLSDNSDVRDAGLNPLLHYLRFGKDEGRTIKDIHGRVSGVIPEYGPEALARLRHLFDQRFYYETNPDLDPTEDGFDHFMSVGWRQRRDPAPWFSTEAYLTDHVDLADDNPFAHYVLSGFREGKTVRNSRRKRMRSEAPLPEQRLSVAAVTMVKNEADIIELFASHLLALFDDIVIVDHQSEDGTCEFLEELAKQFPRVQIFKLCDPSYIQSVTMTHVMRNVPNLRHADWVFFLDADEFLPFQTRDEFRLALKKHQRCPIISMQWQNLVPLRFWSGVVDVTSETEFLVPPAASPFLKVAFQPCRLNIDQVVVAQGNHALIATLNGLQMDAFAADFPLMHIPVRSVDQLLLKLNQGVQSYQKIGRTRDAGQGTHWQRMKDATTSQCIQDSFLNAMAVDYSEEGQSLEPIENVDLIGLGYTRDTVRFAVKPTGIELRQHKGLGEMLMRIYATDFGSAADSDDPGATHLKTCENGNLVCLEDHVSEYPRLPPLAEQPVDFMQALSRFLPASYRDIDDLVPSDWAGHVPFMFSLAALTKPRRYVELGTLHGTGFIAFAQAVKDNQFECEAIAVSPWSTSDSADETCQEIFNTFQFVASKYRNITGILRTGYDQAVHRFADGSIDLLNLDGFFDEEGLTHVLDTWRPKLSKRGMVMLHDVNTSHANSGVWRVWERLRAQYPSLEFRNDKGLGLACIGPAVCPDLLALANQAKEQQDFQMVLQDHFAKQGCASAELFSRRYDMRQMDLRIGTDATLAEELAWNRQELSAAQAELESLRNLLGSKFSDAVGA